MSKTLVFVYYHFLIILAKLGICLVKHFSIYTLSQKYSKILIKKNQKFLNLKLCKFFKPYKVYIVACRTDISYCVGGNGFIATHGMGEKETPNFCHHDTQRAVHVSLQPDHQLRPLSSLLLPLSLGGL